MKILLLGKNGQIGWELRRTLAPLGELIALGRKELDLTFDKEIRRTVREIRPNLIVNAAAYTAVDKAEEEPGIAAVVNSIAPGILAEEAKRLNAGIVHYSTDYVFDGTKTEPYTEEDKPNPINMYGKTKLEGEKAVQAAGVPYLIFRTSWVYGLRGKNFFLAILRLAREKEELQVVDDQIGAPTWCRMIAEATAQVLAQIYSPLTSYSFTEVSGIYHLTAGGQTSWYGFASAILDRISDTRIKCTKLTPIQTVEYPAYSNVNSAVNGDEIRT